MKKISRKILSLVLCLMLLFSLTVMASAVAIEPEEDGVETSSVDIRPIAYDHFYPTPFNTIKDAMNKFGSCYTYRTCYQYYQGEIYNWYFTYSDYSREYLRVICYSDDDTILSIPTETGAQ